MVKVPVVAIVGRPNVGKSTLFNRLSGGRFAIESDVEGTTRDRLYRTIEWNRKAFSLVDTAGLLDSGKGEMQQLRPQIDAAIEEAEVILLVIDGLVSLTKEDQVVIQLLRKQKTPVLVVANKLDRKPQPSEIAEFNKIGLGEPIPVSALHGRGTGDLLDAITERLPKGSTLKEEAQQTRIALIGRPNVGKSSLLNTLTKKQRAVVSDLPGTTRDYVEEVVTYHGKEYCFVDTAGIRRRGKVERGVEQFSVLRSMKSIENSDITVLVIDATEPALSQDLHIAGFAKDAGKGIILVINKWDLVEKDDHTMDRQLTRLRRAFDFIAWAPVIFTSAATGQNAIKLLELVTDVAQETERTVPTPQLNTFFQDLVTQRSIPGRGRYQPKLYYATQTGTKPPTFTLFVKHAGHIHFSWPRFAENQLRLKWGFGGTPIRIHLRERRSS
jgi:GTP-binding protein